MAVGAFGVLVSLGAPPMGVRDTGSAVAFECTPTGFSEAVPHQG